METLLMMVTLVSLGLAVVMSVVGWRLLGGDRRRSAARVEALEAQALDPEDEPGATAWVAADERIEPPAVMHDAMFGGRERPERPSRRWLAVAAVAVLMIGGAGTVFAVYRPAASAGSRSRAAVPTVTGTARPLELLSLRHASDPDGGFAVTGLVENPADGRPLTGIVAVVYLFDRDGQYFASGRSTLDQASLAPGEESPFVVHVPAGAAVGRYRVTFRRDDGGVVPHVDKRSTGGSGE